MLAALLLSAAAAATPGQGLLLPGASPMKDGTIAGGWVTGGGIAVCTEGCGAAAYGDATAWAGFGDESRFVGQIHAIALGGSLKDGGPLIAASVRYLAVDEGKLSVAPWIGVLSDPWRVYFGGSTREVYAGGVALEYGGDRVRLDASLPVLAFPQDEPLRFLVPDGWNALVAGDLVAADLGLSLALGKGHSLRFSKALFFPEMAWRYEKQHVFVEAGLGAWLLVNDVHVRVGGQLGPLRTEKR